MRSSLCAQQRKASTTGKKKKANTQETRLRWKGEGSFIEETGNLRRRQTCVSEPTLKILLGHESV